MDLKRVDPPEAKKLVDDDGYQILDVRSMPEYSAGHPEGAYNVPYLHKTPQGMIPNADFARIVRFLFPDPETKIVTSCQMGGRSVRAAAELGNLGYKNVVDMRGGFGSERDPTGTVVHAGWQASNLPVASGEPEGRSYKSINNQANQARSPKEEESVSPASEPTESGTEEGFNRFASSKRTVDCIRLKRALPGLKRRPFPGALGERIFKEISALAWDAWIEHSKMIINEYRINTADRAAMKLLQEQCEAFFYGDGAARPEGYVPGAP